MSDIVERVRALAHEHYEMLGDIHIPLTEAADTITALRAENEKLRAALKEIAEENIGNTAAISVYIARAALEKETSA